MVAVSCLLYTVGVSLQDLLLQTCKFPLSDKLLMSLLLYLGSFFRLMAGQLQGLQACWVQPNTCPNRSRAYA